MKKSSVKSKDVAHQDVMQRLLEVLPTPEDVDEAVSFIEASARLVQAAAFGVAPKITQAEVIDLVKLAAQLEAHAKRLRGGQLC